MLTDEDAAFDDAMGEARFSLAELTPEMICGGWVLINPFAGIAAGVMRVQVDGSNQNCAGLMPTMLEEVTLPDASSTPWTPSPMPASSTRAP